jgi:uncharacterized membrane protein HdeD (DUF308 family)
MTATIIPFANADKKLKEGVTMTEPAPRNSNTFKLFLTLRGVVSLLFGFAVLVWAISDQGSLAMSFFLYSLIDGLLSLTFSFVIKERGSWIFRAEGVVSLLVAALTLVGPVAFGGIVSHTGSILLPYFIIARFIITGMFQILSIGFLNKASRRGTIVLSGIFAVALGAILIYLHPKMQVFTVVLGVYGVLLGFGLVVLSFMPPSGNGRPRAETQSSR